MAKSEEIYALARPALDRHHEGALATVCRIMAAEPANSTLRQRLQRLLDGQKVRNPKPEDGIRLDNGLDKLVQIQSPTHDLTEVVLSDDMRMRVADLLTEQRYADALEARDRYYYVQLHSWTDGKRFFDYQTGPAQSEGKGFLTKVAEASQTEG